MSSELNTSHQWGDRADAIRELALTTDLNGSEIARKVGCYPSNVSQVMKRFLRNHDLADLDEFQREKATIFEAMQYRTLASITDEDIAKASYLQRITGVAILEDKIRLSRGQPTSMHVTALMDVAGMMREMREQGKLSRQTETIDGNDPSTAGDPGE